MKDFDGIERPEEGDAHTVHLPHFGIKKIKTKKNIRNTNWLYRFGCYVFRVVVTLILTPLNFILFRLKVEGKKHKKAMRKKGFIVVANHCHVMDVTFICTKMMPRTIFSVSLAENFRIPVIGALVHALDALPIPTDMHGMRLFKEVTSDILRENKPMLYFAEGALWPHYRGLRPFKEGAFRAAVQNNVPIMPTVTTFKIIHKSLKRKKYRMTLNFLEPIYPDTTLPQRDAINKLKAETYNVMLQKLEQSGRDDIYTKRYQKQIRKKRENENEKETAIEN